MSVLTIPEIIPAPFFENPEAIQRLMEFSNPAVLVPPRFESLIPELDFSGVGENSLGFFSSGTTGMPKIHALSREKLAWNAGVSSRAFGLTANDRVLILASPWHIAGFTWYAAALHAKSTVRIEIPHISRLPQFAAIIAAFRPTVLFVVPSVLHALLETGFEPVSHIISGGAPVPSEDLQIMHRFCGRLTQAWGQTEAGGLLTFSTRDASTIDLSCFRNVGKPAPGVQLLCYGTEAEPQMVFAQSPSAASDDWYETGDLGWKNSAGDLYLFGRKVQKGNCNSLTGVSMVLHK